MPSRIEKNTKRAAQPGRTGYNPLSNRIEKGSSKKKSKQRQ